MSVQEIRYALANNLAMGMGACERRLRELLAALDEARETNAKLNRRAQRLERRIVAILDGAPQRTLHGLVEDIRAVLKGGE